MRVCFRSSVQPELMDEYKRRHAAVWPEMLRALKDSGWNNYSLFLAPGGQLIGYVECEDYEAAQARMALTDVNARWQAGMAGLFADSNVPPDEGFEIVEEVFNLEDQLASASEAGDAPTHQKEQA
ncbi:L-rhamnose mutarotase [Paenarthrobacter nicotinovorans]|uniref:L-rhamnose mutarotase n=1 Tax=Paenarthrobacter nicotinovorans TaxID=29320 RepID=UPI00278B356D|nr:L-rhamnose mutarotase [Paenarthrobacter nicotinovorans]MDP9937822.1 L-rhamnose mutarotase [Paenarthrobacter nicotinovorans]